MNSTAKHQLQVGLFTALTIIIIGISIFMLGGNKLLQKKYPLKTQFTEAPGLVEGSIVSLSGIVVGNVTHLGLSDESNSIVVTMSIEEAYKSRITEGSSVEIRTQGALGDKYIFINPGPRTNKALEAGSFLAQGRATDFIGVISENADRAEKIFGIVDEVYKLTQSLNYENRTARIIANLETSSQLLNKTMSESLELVKDARGLNKREDSKLASSIDRLDSILGRVERGEGTLGALINDSSLHQQLKALVGTPKRTEHIKGLLRSSIQKEED